MPSAVLLAGVILRGEIEPQPDVLVLEIGCGIGLVSLAAAATGWNVTTSDYDEAP